MVKILTVSYGYGKRDIGGAAKSFLNIISALKKTKNFQIEILYLKPFKQFSSLYGIVFFLYVPKILKKINKIKPNIILTQTSPALPTIIASIIKKIPVINIIRDIHLICPKYVDVIDYGKRCKGLKHRKICYNCINYWRSLRVFIGNKPNGWQFSFKASLKTIGYKIRYFLCKFHLSLIKRATINLVASKLMKSFISTQVDFEKLKTINITPIKYTGFNEIKEKKENQLLFVAPRYEPSYKGIDFILKLADSLSDDYKIVIVGHLIDFNKVKVDKSKIINLGKVTENEINNLYQTSKITLVPTFCTEAFGRVIIESLLNRTPVISSPNCGANEYLERKQFLKVLPLKLNLWKETIKEMIENPPVINDDDVSSIYELFSINKAIEDLSNLVKSLLKDKFTKMYGYSYNKKLS